MAGLCVPGAQDAVPGEGELRRAGPVPGALLAPRGGHPAVQDQHHLMAHSTVLEPDQDVRNTDTHRQGCSLCCRVKGDSSGFLLSLFLCPQL